MIEIRQVGLQATIQDLGRHGYGHLGVPTGGAADAVSLRLANRLVGNDESSAVVEMLMGNVTIAFSVDLALALTGAPCPATLDGRPMAFNTWAYARAGQTLTVRAPVHGLWTYLAVAGGIDVPAVLGSRSTDTLSGLGPPALHEGTSLKLGARYPGVSGWSDVATSTVAPCDVLVVPATLGPRDDLFPRSAITALRAGPWHITQDTNRVAARLSGPVLETDTPGQLPTEGLALGSIQVPPSGQPIVHLANHPPTGGYPVIAVIDDAYVHRIAQAEPGTEVAFTLRGPSWSRNTSTSGDAKRRGPVR